MSGRSVEVGTIRQHCKTLRMPTVASQCHKLAEQARRDKQSHVRYLDVLLSAEVEEREHRAVQRSSDAMPASSGTCQQLWDTRELHLVSLDYGGETREVGAIDVNIDQDLVA